MRLLIILFTCVIFYEVSCRNNNVKQLTESQGQEIIEIGHPIRGLEEEPSADVDDNLIYTNRKDRKSTTMRDVDKIDGVTPEDEEEAKIAKELAEIYKDTSDYKDSDEEDEKPADSNPESTEEPKPTTTQDKPKATTQQPKTQETKNVVKEIKQDTKNVVKDVKQEAKTVVKDVKQEAKTVVKDIKQEAKTVVKDIKQDNKNAIKDVKQDAKNVVKKLKLDAKNDTKDTLRLGKKKSFKFQPDSTDRASIERFRTSIDDLSCNNKKLSQDTTDSTIEPEPDNSSPAIRVSLLSLLFSSIILYCNN